ncbi:hypothetical protein WJX72_011098 [[Myrmecia] bisecta]|uniref:Eukaryotic translation initiation factor 3 subunit L n=1 Tax=[Myrmecia] bisecta TaxID=41462 RepID=A0AAW1QTP0_9CHLO
MRYGHPAAGADSRFAEPVPDMVKQFVVYFYRHIRERNVREIHTMYDTSFAKLSERFYKTSSWPPVDAVADLVDQDHVFCLLYKEMYFRHLYAVAQPSLEQRAESWDNYCSLFNVVLHGNVNMQLPNAWLWDMVDEFIYQFQSFAQYRGRLQNKAPEELQMLRKCASAGVWDVLSVLNYLQALIDKSGVVKELSTEGGAQRFNETEGYEQHSSNVLPMVGYFSLVGLLRVHSLFGDYHGALKALAPINPFVTKHLFTPKIAGCNITLYYYGGFCYLMQRRYLDAAKAFNLVLSYIARVKQYHARSAQYDQILKKNEQIYALLAITTALCPAANNLLDENILNALQEKSADKISKMKNGSENAFEDLFSYACPKFVTAAPPSLDNPNINTNQEAYRLQLRCFLGLIHEQRHLPTLKQFLKLYTSISLPKLASLMELDEATVRGQLLVLKAASFCKTWSGTGDATEGTVHAAADVDFYIDINEAGTELVHVSDTKVVRRQGEFLARHISKFADIVRDLNTPELPNVPLAPAPMTATY